MTAYDEAEPFDPATMCHPDPLIGGDPEGRCVYIVPCRLRCHTRYLDGQHQPNDWLFGGACEPADLPKLRGHGVDADCECCGDDQPAEDD